MLLHRLKGLGTIAFVVSPIIVIAWLTFYPGSWNAYYPTEVIDSLYSKIIEFYQANGIAMITLFISLVGIAFFYFGAIISSEKKHNRVAENLEAKLNTIALFTGIPTLIALGYVLVHITQIFTVSKLLIAYFFILILAQQIWIISIVMNDVSERYSYEALLKRLRTSHPFGITYDPSNLKMMALFQFAWLFLLTYVLLRTNISIFLILILLWLVFVSATEIALMYSLGIADYHLVDIKGNDFSFTEAFLIREEKDDFLRIVPKPENDPSIGILINKNDVQTISYRRDLEKESGKGKKVN